MAFRNFTAFQGISIYYIASFSIVSATFDSFQFFHVFPIFSKAHILRRPGLNKRPWMFLLKRQQSQVLSAFAAVDVSWCRKMLQASTSFNSTESRSLLHSKLEDIEHHWTFDVFRTALPFTACFDLLASSLALTKYRYPSSWKQHTQSCRGLSSNTGVPLLESHQTQQAEVGRGIPEECWIVG